MECATRKYSVLRKQFGTGGTAWNRERTRYGVRVPVDFEWLEKGVVRRGRGLTRDISTKGMFIYSDSEPPAMADLRVRVSFRSFAEAERDLQVSAKASVIRVEPPLRPEIIYGFAILNTSYKLQLDETSIEGSEE